MPLGTCPECEAEVHVDTDADKGDAVTCEECGTDLEITWLSTLASRSRRFRTKIPR